MGIRLLVNGDISMGNAYSYWEKTFVISTGSCSIAKY